MTKKYKLLKDLPNVSKGMIWRYSFAGNTCHYRPDCTKNGKQEMIDQSIVENTPEWFEEVVEQERIEVSSIAKHDNYFGNKSDSFWYQFFTTEEISKGKRQAIRQAIEDVLNPQDVFVWTDELVIDFINFRGKSTQASYILFEQFKQSKQSAPVDTVVKDWKGHKFENGKLTVPQDVAERLRPLTPEYQQEKLYTQAKLDKAIEEAFMAGKFSYLTPNPTWVDFLEYKATLTNPSK